MLTERRAHLEALAALLRDAAPELVTLHGGMGVRARRRGRRHLLKQTPDLLFGIGRCLWSLGALAQTLVWDRQAGLHATGGRPTDDFAAFCGQLRVDWHFCDARDPQAKGVVERLQDFMKRSFEPGRCFANELDCQLQLDCWFSERANARMHTTLRARPIDRLIEEHAVMAPLPATMPETDRRWMLRVAPDPYLRFATSSSSPDDRSPGAQGRRTISKLESGTHVPTIPVLTHILAVLDERLLIGIERDTSDGEPEHEIAAVPELIVGVAASGRE